MRAERKCREAGWEPEAGRWLSEVPEQWERHRAALFQARRDKAIMFAKSGRLVSAEQWRTPVPDPALSLQGSFKVLDH